MTLIEEAILTLRRAGYVIEDFGIGVGGMTGADQGIMLGGDAKAVVPYRAGGVAKRFHRRKRRRRIRK